VRSLWQPERRAVSYQDVWGAGGNWQGGNVAASRVTVNPDTALGLDAVWACVNMHAGMAASLPVDAFRGENANPVSPVPTILDRPSLVLPFDDWLFQYYVSLLVFGNVYGVVLERDRLQYPVTVEWQDPTTVEVEQVNHRAIYRFQGQQVPSEDVWHDRWFVMPGSLVGRAPLTMHRETIGLGLAAQKFGAQWFGDGAHPSAVLSTDQQVTQEQAATIKARFVAAIRNTREPAVLGAGMTYQQIQTAPNESQFLETQQNVAISVARVFGIQPEMIAAATSGSSVTYANVEQQAIQYLTFGLDRWLVKGERSISRHLPRGMFAKFNRGALMRTDLLSRYRAHAIALNGRFLNIDEVRELEDRPPLDNGDEFPPETIQQGGI
jgi:HK97 family phage portal protein